MKEKLAAHSQKFFASRSDVLTAFVFALAVYIGIYALLVDPINDNVFFGIGPWEYEMEDDYSVIGGFGDIVFWPVNQVDRLIRPDVWNGIHDPYVR